MGLSIKQVIEGLYWNAEKGGKYTNPDGKKLNGYLEQLRSSYVECFRQMSLHRKNITTETFKNAYFNVEEEKMNPSLPIY